MYNNDFNNDYNRALRKNAQMDRLHAKQKFYRKDIFVVFFQELRLFCKASVPERKPQKYLYQSGPCKALNPNIGIENDRVYNTDYRLITYDCIKNDGTDKNR